MLQPIQRCHLGNRVSKFTISVLLRQPRIKVSLDNPLPPPAPSVSGLGVELLADVVDDLGYKLVEVVELVHKEGVLLVRVCGNVLQLILGGPGDSNGIGDHTWITGQDSRLHTGAHIGLSHQTHIT